MPSIRKWIIRLFEFLLDNLAVLLTIVFTAYIIYRQQVQGVRLSTNDLLTAILGILGLLAISEVVERYRRFGKIDKSNAEEISLIKKGNAQIEAMIEGRMMDHPSALGFFEKEPDLDPLIRNAMSIDMCGFALTTKLSSNMNILRERLKAGAKIRVLIADSDSLALPMAVERSEGPDAEQIFRDKLQTSYTSIRILSQAPIQKEWIPRYTPRGGTPQPGPAIGSFEARRLGYAPSFGVTLINRSQSNALAIVEIYAHMTYEAPPVFSLTPQRDGAWYRYFVQQFNSMWAAASEWPETSDKAEQSGDPYQ